MEAKTVNGASCNGVGTASSEQDERVAGQPNAGHSEKEQTHETEGEPAVEGEDEGGADSGASS